MCGTGLFCVNSFTSPSPNRVSARLISEDESIRPGGSFVVGLRLEMDEGWHTYWKNPGDSGMPTRIEWSLPEGFTAKETLWPYPGRFETAGLVSFGYEGEVVLLTEMEAPAELEPGSTIELQAKVEWLACKEECVAGRANLSLELPVKDRIPKRQERWAALFEKTRTDLPRLLEHWEINASLDKEKAYIHIIPSASFGREMRDILFFPEQEGIVQYAESQLLRKVQQGYVMELKRSGVSPAVPSRLQGVLCSPAGWDGRGKVKALRVDVPWTALEKSLMEGAR